MNLKSLIPGKFKTACKFMLYDLLKVPYSRSGVPLEITNRLSSSTPITFIDIGANVGHFSIHLCKEYQIKRGILIEPLSNLISTLQQTFPDKSRFNILNIAVSNSTSETDFFVSEEFDSVSSLLEIYNDSNELESLKLQKPKRTTIQTQTLDSVVEQENLSYIDLLKIDVQGAEHLVLESAVETLKITRLVYTEFSFKPLYNNSSTFFDLYQIFYQHDFVLVSIGEGYTSASGELLQGDALFMNKRFLK